MHKHQRKERKKRSRREERSREEGEEGGEEEEDGTHQLLEVITGELLLPHAVNLAGDEGGSPKLHLLQAQAMEEPQVRSISPSYSGVSCCSRRPSLTW